MSILYFLLSFVACAAAAAAGAFGMRFYAEQTRVVAEREDPRDTQIRDLQAMLKVAKTDVQRARDGEADAREHLQLAHERIEELGPLHARALQQYETCKTVLKTEIGEKNSLRDALAEAERQLARQRDRIEELEVEASMQDASEELLDPSVQARHAEAEAGENELPGINTPELQAEQPSLIESLTQELDRWKRHCHVLGAALRAERERADGGRDAGVAPANPQAEVAPADSLTEIRGIGAAIERKLHQLGIYRFAELAKLEIEEPAEAALLIPDLRSRMRRDNWTEQARSLHEHKYNEAL